MILTELADIIILVGAVFMVFVNITKNISSGNKWFAARKQSDIEEILDKKMPEYLANHSASVKPDRIQETQKQIDNALAKQTEVIEERLCAIENKVEKIDEAIDRIENSNTDLLRREINKIYCKYRPYKKITQYDKSDVIKLSTDYFAEDGNSYVEDLLEQMSSWEVVESVDEIEGFEERQ